MAIGDIKTVHQMGRLITMKQVAESGFGMWKILKNEPLATKLSKAV